MLCYIYLIYAWIRAPCTYLRFVCLFVRCDVAPFCLFEPLLESGIHILCGASNLGREELHNWQIEMQNSELARIVKLVLETPSNLNYLFDQKQFHFPLNKIIFCSLSAFPLCHSHPPLGLLNLCFPPLPWTNKCYLTVSSTAVTAWGNLGNIGTEREMRVLIQKLVRKESLRCMHIVRQRAMTLCAVTCATASNHAA